MFNSAAIVIHNSTQRADKIHDKAKQGKGENEKKKKKMEIRLKNENNEGGKNARVKLQRIFQADYK